MIIKHNIEKFNAVNAFDMKVTYSETDCNWSGNQLDAHVHEECEIYINLSGDVSFMVENRLYPVSYGNIIITRPFEYHHCIYHSDKVHKHFWILFSASGNEEFLDVFFNRKLGEGNFLSLPIEETEELISLCHELTEKTDDSMQRYYKFFKLLTLLKSAESISASGTYSQEISTAINYINANLSSSISIKEVAKRACVSVNTLERHFQKTLNVSPNSYIKKKRLAYAAKLLASGCSVAEASENSGFSDYSSFIALFKKTYGLTPYKYKRNLDKNNNR